MRETQEDIDSEAYTPESPAQPRKVSAKEVLGYDAASAVLINAAGSSDERRARAAISRMVKNERWDAVASMLVPVEDPQLQEQIRQSGAEIFEGDSDDPSTAGKLFVRAYDLPMWSEAINQSSDLYPTVQDKFTGASPHIADPEGKSVKQLQETENKKAEQDGEEPRKVTPVVLLKGMTLKELQDKEDEQAALEGRPARLFVQNHHIARVINTIQNYINSETALRQSEYEYAEWARLAEEDPSIAAEFGAFLGRLVNGGSAGARTLARLASNKSRLDTINRLLSVPDSGTKHDDLRKYIEESQQLAANGNSASADSE